jgi:beta-lactamase regulating signal transducer with metallopeptidase domain
MIHVVLFGVEAGLGLALTYLVHSTLWIVGAMLLVRFQRALSASARHMVWRAALCGPLASSAFALGLGHRWQWALPGLSAPEPVWSALPFASTLRPLILPSSLERLNLSTPDEPALGGLAALASAWLPSGSAALLSCWALVALGGLLLLLRALVRQRRALGRRAPITDVISSSVLSRLARRAGIRHPIRLTRSARASSPLVLSAQEICLPARALELDPGALEAVLAHELAHIERRDGLWLYAALTLQALLWFQPLNRRARAELQESAELAADDRAVELTGNALGLARTLTQVAGWLSVADAAPSLAMARVGSPIVERVARLVEASDSGTPFQRSSRVPWFALAALTAIGACSPSVGAPQAPLPRALRVPVNAPAPATMFIPIVLPADGQLFRAPPSAPLLPVPAPASEVCADTVEPTLRAAPQRRRVAKPAQSPAPAAAKPAKSAVPVTARERVILPMPPIDLLVNEMVGQVAPRAVAFSQAVSKLAWSEHNLRERIRRAEQSASAPSASTTATPPPDLGQLRRELAASVTRRERLERDFETHMQAWSKAFQQRFDTAYAPRLAAWSEDVGRQLHAKAGEDRRDSSARTRRPPRDRE